MDPKEKCFFRVCYKLTKDREIAVWEVMQMFANVISEQEMLEFLTKWTRLGFYDYGTVLQIGWILPYKIPHPYLQLLIHRGE